jgi:hypothetical protein
MRAYRIVPGFILVAAACGGGPSLPPVWPWIEVGSEARLYSDNASGLQDSVRIVIRDAAQLRDVWGRATSRQMSPPPLPAIDFEDEMVLAVGAGRMTVEDRIRVDSVVVREEVTTTGERDVFSVIVRVIQGCGQFDTEAFPVEIVRVQRFEGPVRFVERRSRVEGCGGVPVYSRGASDSR